jgi:hypothetical protein
LYGGCSDGVSPISMTASIATFQSCNADTPLRLLRHHKNSSFKTTVSPFSRSRWSVVRSASRATGGTSKKRPSPHLHKVQTLSNKASPRTLQTALPYVFLVDTTMVWKLRIAVTALDCVTRNTAGKVWQWNTCLRGVLFSVH